MALERRRRPQVPKKQDGYRFSGGPITAEGVAGGVRDNLIPLAVMAGAVYLFMNRKK